MRSRSIVSAGYASDSSPREITAIRSAMPKSGLSVAMLSLPHVSGGAPWCPVTADTRGATHDIAFRPTAWGILVAGHFQAMRRSRSGADSSYNDGCEAEHARIVCSGFDVTSTKSLPYIVEPIRIFKRKIQGPSIRIFQQLYVDFCNVVSLVDDLRPFPLVHLRLRLNPDSHRSGSGKYAVIGTAGLAWPAGSPRTAWTGRPSFVRWSNRTHGPLG